MCVYLFIYIYRERDIHRERDIERERYIYIYILGPPKRGVSKPTVYHFPRFPLYEICLLVWDSGLELIDGN